MGRRAVLLLALLALAACADPKGADTTTGDGVLSGSILTAEDCARHPETSVWVVVDGTGECIRYYHSGLGEATPVVHVWFHGDRMMQWTDGRSRVGRSYEDSATPEGIARRVALGRDWTGGPYIRFSRPGVFGSSGFHKQRRLAREGRIVTRRSTPSRRGMGSRPTCSPDNPAAAMWWPRSSPCATTSPAR